jgi:hypothetical protein
MRLPLALAALFLTFALGVTFERQLGHSIRAALHGHAHTYCTN